VDSLEPSGQGKGRLEKVLHLLHRGGTEFNRFAGKDLFHDVK